MTSTKAIDSPKAFEEWLNDTLADPTKAQAAIADGKLTAGISDYVAAAVEAKGKVFADLRDQVLSEAEKALADAVGAERARALNLNPLASTRVPSARRAPGAQVDGIFADFTEFLQDTWHKARPDAAGQKRLQAYTEKSPADGGFLVPEEFRQSLLVHALESAIVKPRATVIPMASAKLTMPAIDETSHTSTVYGGVQVYRTEEAGALVESGGSFRKVELDLTKQTALAYFSNELIRDTAGGAERIARQMIGSALVFFEDRDYIDGSGVGEPLGELTVTNPGTISIAKETGQEAATINWQNIIKMFARLLPQSHGSAEWVVSLDAFPQLATMGLIVGTGGAPTWYPGASGGGTAAPPMTLLGRPIRWTEKAPGTLGTRGDISLVDHSYYLVGEGQSMLIETSPHFRFGNDQTTVRAVQRNDGRPWQISPITPANNGPTLAATVQLDTRA